jgi:hypothetical protein
MKSHQAIIYGIIILLSSCGVPHKEHIELQNELAIIKEALAECKNNAAHSKHSMITLSPAKKIAFMSGHVAAGLALYRAGKLDQAAPHLMHPVSETHQKERAGIDSLGFKPEVFKLVSKALDEDRPASEIEPMLVAAEANILLLQQNAGGNPNEIIAFLMEKVAEEYQAGVSNQTIIESGEYQDAFGFSVVALTISKRSDKGTASQRTKELIKLVKMWPEAGPITDAKPKALDLIIQQTNTVLNTL